MVTVKTSSAVKAEDKSEWLKTIHGALKIDAAAVKGRKVSYVCTFGMGPDGYPVLRLLTNVDYREGRHADLVKGSRVLKKLGHTYRRLLKRNQIEVCDVGQAELVPIFMSMLNDVIRLQSSQYEALWGLSSSCDLRVKGIDGAVNTSQGATQPVSVEAREHSGEPGQDNTATAA